MNGAPASNDAKFEKGRDSFFDNLISSSGHGRNCASRFFSFRYRPTGSSDERGRCMGEGTERTRVLRARRRTLAHHCSDSPASLAAARSRQIG